MNPAEPIEAHLRITYPGQSGLQLLDGNVALSARDIRACFSNGAVWLQASGKPRRLYDADRVLRTGQQLHLYCNRSTLAPCPYQPQLIADCDSFSIWNKPAGMFSQGSKWGDHWTLQRWIEHNHWPQRKCLITHRLDRFTRGLMIVAHDEAVNRDFHRRFEQRKIDKAYRAIVHGLRKTGDAWHIDTPIDHKDASTHVRVLETDPAGGRSLLQAEPHSGRKHQIRIHLAAAGLPIVNDRQYGKAACDGDIALQACALDFDNPLNGKRLSIRLDDDKLLTL